MRFNKLYTISGLAVTLLLPAVGSSAEHLEASELAPRPPRNVAVEKLDWEELSDTNISKFGKVALAVDRDQWNHAETDNFVLHFRRITEARKVARELEFVLWFAAKKLHASPDDYQRKSHAYIFEDEQEWKQFVTETGLPEWSNSVAVGDDLFLNVRYAGSSRRFDSNTLAHEATHAAVARIFQGQRWPLWLNEGFAEFMAAAGVAERKNHTLGRYLQPLPNAVFSLEQLQNSEFYPTSHTAISQFYQSSERVVRFMMLELPEERFRRFVDSLISNGQMEAAVMEVYKDIVKNYEEFYERLSEYEG